MDLTNTVHRGDKGPPTRANGSGIEGRTDGPAATASTLGRGNRNFASGERCGAAAAAEEVEEEEVEEQWVC